MKTLKTKIAILLVLIVPGLTLASTLESLFKKIGDLINTLLPITFGLALLFFFYGLAMFILRSGQEKESGKSIMIWGVLALFIMASIFGIIAYLQRSVQINNNTNITVPTFCNGGTC